MFAEIAYDWEHVSWRFQVVSPAPTCLLPGFLLFSPLWVPSQGSPDSRSLFPVISSRAPSGPRSYPVESFSVIILFFTLFLKRKKMVLRYIPPGSKPLPLCSACLPRHQWSLCFSVTCRSDTLFAPEERTGHCRSATRLVSLPRETALACLES